MKQKWLTIEAVEWYKHKLVNWMSDSVQRVTDYLNATNDLENSHEDVIVLASTIVDMNEKIVEDMESQIEHWLTLKLTAHQRTVVKDCKEEILKMKEIQRLFERTHPVMTGECHVPSLTLQ